MRILSGKLAACKVRDLSERSLQLDALEPVVRKIIVRVRTKGDVAVCRYAKRWDGLMPEQDLRVTTKEIDQAWNLASKELKNCLAKSANNIREFCEWQKPAEWYHARGGVSVGQVIRPLDSVACYVPGGRYPLVSSLLMTVIPAQVAGVKRICVASPKAHSQVLAAAGMLGITEIYRIGGAQAIAALAYGTETIGRVAKIVGPGNSYVTTAKKLVAFDCAIDFLAGPTEAVVVSNNGHPEYIAADLVAQAEHDPEAFGAFITTNRKLAEEVNSRCAHLARYNSIARMSLLKNGVIFLAETREQALEWANSLAPEHITIEEDDIHAISNAGSIFVGDYSAQSAGDYASGPNHVLPTAGSARFRGGLSVIDFVKIITVQKLSAQGLSRLSNVACSLAQTEGLRAHAESIQLRCSHA